MGIESHPFSNPYTAGLIAITDNNIQAAVEDWVTQPAIAAAKYGHIAWWDVGEVTSMDELFCGQPSFCTNFDANINDKATFQDDLSHW